MRYNKPASYWYNKMLEEISQEELNKADDTYISLESEHRKSPLLESATFIIASAHMHTEEYTMANYYFDQYIKKFVSKDNIDYVRYLKIKSKFLAFAYQFREQELLYATIKETQEFIDNYPNSKYLYLVNTIQSRLYMGKAFFDNEISALYDRIDKPKASKLYKNKAKQSWANTKDIQKVNTPWYRAVFE
ncbi:Putative lipoprotein [hydrothermal vent metagenome]|uniref:Lipoprotein n=1 Tax=hydrothermal vent metagenome TaxID=652676 RepID=A0A3B1EA25_9ZZZZ